MPPAKLPALSVDSPLGALSPTFAKSGRGLSLPRGLVLTVLAGLLVVVAFQVRTLWAEYRVLLRERDGVRLTEVIGYPGISPITSFAQKPDAWFREEGGRALLWAGWREGVGHQWFRCAPGDVDRSRISPPIGRDLVRAIDFPVVESRGGEIWARIPDGDDVAALGHGGVESAYPVLVLGKVGVVNDLVGDRPVLITWNPLAPAGRKAAAYESAVDGRRVTMGLAGYFLGGHPVLYDRRTESLWAEVDGTLVAVAGARKGERLRPIGRPSPVAWKRWKADHPDGRLVVGADRSRPIPEG